MVDITNEKTYSCIKTMARAYAFIDPCIRIYTQTDEEDKEKERVRGCVCVREREKTNAQEIESESEKEEEKKNETAMHTCNRYWSTTLSMRMSWLFNCTCVVWMP